MSPGQRFTRIDRSIDPRTSGAVPPEPPEPVPPVAAAGVGATAGDSPGASDPSTVTLPDGAVPAAAGSVTNPRTTARRAPVSATTIGATTQYPWTPSSR